MRRYKEVVTGVLVWKYYRLLMCELEKVREELGEGWQGRRRNLQGVEERYYPVLDGVYKLARAMRSDAEALMEVEERELEIETEQVVGTICENDFKWHEVAVIGRENGDGGRWKKLLRKLKIF